MLCLNPIVFVDLLCGLFVNTNSPYITIGWFVTFNFFFYTDSSSMFISLKFTSFACRDFYSLDFADRFLN